MKRRLLHIENCRRGLKPISNVDYGYLYNWYAVDDANGLAPDGWHIPTVAEWDALTTYLGGDTVAGGEIKEVGLNHWTTPNTGANDSVGFKAFPGGNRNNDASFANINNNALFWAGDNNTFYYALYNSITFNDVVYSSLGGNSIRCIKDSAVGWSSGDTLTDIDGNIYETVNINGVIWMVQNLATTKYKNGNSIPNIVSDAAWIALTSGGLCAYDNFLSNVFIENAYVVDEDGNYVVDENSDRIIT